MLECGGYQTRPTARSALTGSCRACDARWVRSLWPGLLVLAAGTGCLSPPAVQVATGIGVRSGAGNGKLESPFELRAAVHPLQVVHSLLHREGDFGVGYLLDAGTGGPKRVIQGGYGEGSWIFFDGRVSDNVFGRLAVRGQGRVLVDGNGTVGGGGALQLTGELADWFKPACDAGGGGAFCIGTEGALGFYVEAAYGNLYSSSIWSGGAGLTIRTPFLAAIAAFHK